MEDGDHVAETLKGKNYIEKFSRKLVMISLYTYLQSLGDGLDVGEAADLGEGGAVELQLAGLLNFVEIVGLEVFELQLGVGAVVGLVDSCEVVDDEPVLLEGQVGSRFELGRDGVAPDLHVGAGGEETPG